MDSEHSENKVNQRTKSPTIAVEEDFIFFRRVFWLDCFLLSVK